MTHQRALYNNEIPSFEEMVQNIFTDYAHATRLPDVYSVGLTWFNVGRQDCQIIQADLAGIRQYSLKNVIDTVAIISPAINWIANKRDAQSILIAHAQYTSLADRIAYSMDCGVQTPYGWQNHKKAWQVLDGAISFDCKPTSFKTWNFGQCLENPDHSLAVCIDQHMVHVLIADGRQGSIRITAKQYKLFVSVLRHCAESLGILPSKLQAIIWQYRQYKLGYMVD